MLSRDTVFVVGAGASFELGLPLGESLREEIAALVDIRYDGFRPISGDDQINHYLREIAQEKSYPNINDLLHKCRLIRDALPGSISIDNLLDAHRNDPDIAEIGKLAIAKAILGAERRSKLYKPENEPGSFHLSSAAGTYLIPLFQILSEGVTKENVDSIFSNCSFVVFNYDRTLEYFLPKALQRYYGLDTSSAENIVQSATIIHPYGRVGEFGRGKSLESAAFGANRPNLRSIAAGIRTFSEGLADEGHANAIDRLVSRSEQIIFLGFAFHPLNMEILNSKSAGFLDKVFGTTLNLSDAAVRSVEGIILQTFGKESPNSGFTHPAPHELSELNLEPRTAADFLQAHFRGIA